MNRSISRLGRPILLVMSATLLLGSLAALLICGSPSAFTSDLDKRLAEHLTREDSQISANAVDAVYLLGGSQHSLEFKFRTAAALYKKGICRRIFILSRPGKTEFSSSLGRNLTNDEWAIQKLEELGIPKRDVEALAIEREFFGTFAEAKGISQLIKKRGYKSIVLISSPHHANRVKISFDEFLKDLDIKCYVLSSTERSSLKDLIIEFIKLKTYEHFLVS